MLRQLRLVVGQRTGRQVIYALHDDHVAALLNEAVFYTEHLRLAAINRSAQPAGRELASLARPGFGERPSTAGTIGFCLSTASRQ